VHNPAVGDIIGRTPLSTAEDVDAAVQAAAQAFPGWRETPVNARAQYLYRFKALCEQHGINQSEWLQCQCWRCRERREQQASLAPTSNTNEPSN